MSVSFKRLLPLLAPAALAFACAASVFMRGTDLKTSLYDLMGDAGEAIPDAVRELSSSTVPVIVSSRDPAAARRAAETFAAEMPREGVKAVRLRMDESLPEILDFVSANAAGLASEEARELLKTPEGRAKIARRHMKRIYADPMPTLFTPETDPFGLAEGFVKSRASGQAGWTLSNGMLTAGTNGVSYVLLTLELEPETASDTDLLIAFSERLDAAASALRGEGASVTACGVPVHAARTASKCKSQIGWLSAVSIVFIALLSAFAFRSVKWIPLLASSLVTAGLAGTLALLLFFGSVHIMTFVFGTTVLGLVVDYSFHWLMQRPGHKAAVTKSLLVSFATTELSLLPLALSSIPVLRQSAVFLGTGLAAALASVLAGYPPCREEREDSHAPTAIWITSRRGSLILLAIFVAAAVFGLSRLGFGTSLEALYSPPRDLAEAERFLAERSGAADSSHGTLLIEGETLDDRLEKEESLRLPASVPHLSAFLPSLATRRAVADDVSKLYAEHGAKMASVTGAEIPDAAPEPAPWTEDSIPHSLAGAFLPDGALVVPSAPAPDMTLPDGVAFWRPRPFLAAALDSWTGETLRRLAVSLCVLLAFLAVIYRRAAFAVLAPSVLSLAAVGALLGFLGRDANLFHLLAAFLLVGMSLDYSVFLREGGSAVLKPALCSLATSLVGFGLLAFVAFPVVSAFGVVLGAGLPAAFLAALLISLSPRAAEDRIARETGTEHAASPLGLETLYVVYSVFGLRFLHFIAAIVGLSAWTFSSGVRKASPRPAKVVAFTRSLSDKMAVMAEGRSLPEVTPDGSPDAAEFMGDVKAGRGVFILSSHIGTVEVLVALGECRATFHAWMDIARTSVFNAFYLRHAKRKRVVIHPVSEIGMASAFMAADALENGDSLVMAGDRGRGAFRFAHAMDAKVYFVACVPDGPASYKAVIRRLPHETEEMEKSYFAVRDALAAEHPDQVFDWNGQTEGEKS